QPRNFSWEIADSGNVKSVFKAWEQRLSSSEYADAAGYLFKYRYADADYLVKYGYGSVKYRYADAGYLVKYRYGSRQLSMVMGLLILNFQCNLIVRENMDKSWMNIAHRLSDPRYELGVNEFLDFSYRNKQVSSKVPCPYVLDKEEERITLVLCKFERIFPSSFFDIMVHLLIHLPYEENINGPPEYRWMFPFERKMRTLKGYVKNQAHPEGLHCTRNSCFPNNSFVTIPRRRNKRRTPNVVEPELRTIVEMADNCTMEKLLQAPTEGYGEAIVIPEINAGYFEIKTNLLQLVQANPYHGFERENPHTHINNFKKITSTLKFRDVPNDVIKLMVFPYSLEGNSRVCKSDDRIDKITDQISTLVDIFAKKVVTPAPVKAVEQSCVTCGGAHAYYNCPNTDSNQPSVCVATGTYNQVAPQNRASNFMAPPGFASVQK
nr:reverse transcriptase domain-containing protein [Tanacetum cinerariifolium]